MAMQREFYAESFVRVKELFDLLRDIMHCETAMVASVSKELVLMGGAAVLRPS